MEIQVKKVKLRDAMFANVEFDEVHESATDQVTKVCNNPVHADFKEKMAHLGVHAILICELVDITKLKLKDLDDYHPPLLEYITIHGVTIKEGEGVTISFERKLSTGKVINLNTPYTKYYEDNGYKYGDDLQIAIDELVKEVEAYLEGKFGEGAQLSMEFENNEDAPL